MGNGRYIPLIIFLLLSNVSCHVSPAAVDECNPSVSVIDDYDFVINGYGAPVSWSGDSFPIPVIISPEFDEFEVLAIENAIRHWNETIGQTVFVPMLGLSNEVVWIPGSITITEQHLPENCGSQELGLNTRRWRTDFWREPIEITTSHIEIHDEHDHDATYLRTVVHELGHALGLHHDEDRSSVMYPHVLSSEWHLEEIDIDFVRTSMRVILR